MPTYDNVTHSLSRKMARRMITWEVGLPSRELTPLQVV